MTTLFRRKDDFSDLPALARADTSPVTRLATPHQRRVALGSVIMLTIVTLALLPVSADHWSKFQAFFPTYQATVIVIYLITGYLMFGQYTATRSASLLHLSAGTFYTAGVLIVQLLALPGAFLDKGQLIGGPQSLTYLWLFWHIGPAISVLFYAFSEIHKPGGLTVNHVAAIIKTFGVAFVAFVATVLLVTKFNYVLPTMDVNGDFSGITRTGAAPVIEGLLALALFFLWRAGGFRSVMQVWLAVALVGLLCDNAVTMAGATRLSIGWYTGRFGALISAVVMLFVYLQEIKLSYVRASDKAVDLESANAQLTVRLDESRRDSLTNLLGRELFVERAEALRLDSLERQTGFATLFIDLDGFKAVNDIHGHESGDQVLRSVATAIRSVLRPADVAGRVGGDEFVVCLAAPADMSLAIANKVSERLGDKIAKIGDHIGASIGISVSTESIEVAIHEADEAMYEAKRAGKNRSSLYRMKPKLAFSA